MNIKYDPDADSMYIRLRDTEVAKTKKIEKNIIIDYDKDGYVRGVELIFVKENNPNLLKTLQVENLVSA